jgi:hypothetical protein
MAPPDVNNTIIDTTHPTALIPLHTPPFAGCVCTPNSRAGLCADGRLPSGRGCAGCSVARICVGGTSTRCPRQVDRTSVLCRLGFWAAARIGYSCVDHVECSCDLLDFVRAVGPCWVRCTLSRYMLPSTLSAPACDTVIKPVLRSEPPTLPCLVMFSVRIASSAR